MPIPATPDPTPAAPQKRRALSVWLGALLKYGVPPVITVGLCYLLLTGMDVRRMWHTVVTECRVGWLAAAMGLSVLSNVIRAARWRIQLRALGVEAGMWELTLSFFGTYAVNLVFPRLGEFWRTGWVAKRADAKFSTVFGSMVADRLTDTISVALLTALAFVLAGSHLTGYLQQTFAGVWALLVSPWTLAGAAALTALGVWAFTRHSQNVVVRRARELLRGLWQGFAVIGRMPGVGRWALLTVALWACYYSQLYLEFYSFPLTGELADRHGPVAVLVCFVLSSISMGVPSNGGIGPWQWAMICGLTLYAAGIAGLDRDYMTAFANLVMGAQTALLIVLGIFTFVCIAFMKKQHARRKT